MGSSKREFFIEMAIMLALIFAISFLSKSNTFRFIARTVVSLLLWVIAFYGTFIHKDYGDWDFTFSDYIWLNKTVEYSIKLLLMIFWTIILYLFAAYGIGGEGGPWEDV